MPGKNTDKKYYYKPEESGYYAPELMVTPDISYPAAVLSNGDFGVTYGTLKDIGVPVYYSKEKPYNQDYNEGITQSAASALADQATALKFPSLSDLREYYSLPKIRERLFLGVRPQGYGEDRKKEAFSAITGLGYNNLRKQRTTENPIIESLWAEYLQQPSYMINELYPDLPQNYLIGKSDYVPTINGNSSDNYLKINSSAENYGKHPVYRNTKGNSDIYRLDMPFDFVNKFVKNGYERSHIGGNKDFPEYNYNLGEYIGTRGMDDRGDYVSYYDKWDLSPFGGTEDQSMGIGKPLNIYDRVYLDDYYGVSEPTHATYLPEVEVTQNNHSQGGPLKSKFWNDLSMKEKSEMIRVAVNEGITDIGEIRDRYNKYAESFI